MSEIPVFGIASWKISWLHGISKLEDKTSELSFAYEQPILRSQRSGSKKLRLLNSIDEFVTSRSIAGQFFFSICLMRWLRQPWRNFSTRSQISGKECRRAASSEFRPILTRKPNCVHDLREFPCNRSLWSSTGTRRLGQYDFAEWRRPRSRCKMWSCAINSNRNAFRPDPGRIVQVKITGLCSASDCFGFVRSRNRSK